MTAVESLPVLKLEDPDWYLGDPHATYRTLRRESPVHWVEPHGFWFLTKYADVHAVSKDPGLFSSSRGFRINDGLKPPSPVVADFPPTILSMDPQIITLDEPDAQVGWTGSWVETPAWYVS